MTPATLRAQHTYCRTGTDCVRAWLHSGPHLPGCRTCGATDHRTNRCPGETMGDDFLHDPQSMRGPLVPPVPPRMPSPYIWLPLACRTGICGHEGACVRYRSPRCPSGECTHASRGLACGEAVSR